MSWACGKDERRDNVDRATIWRQIQFIHYPLLYTPLVETCHDLNCWVLPPNHYTTSLPPSLFNIGDKYLKIYTSITTWDHISLSGCHLLQPLLVGGSSQSFLGDSWAWSLGTWSVSKAVRWLSRLYRGRVVGCHLGDVTFAPYLNVLSWSEDGHLHAVMLIVMPSILFLLLLHPLG